VKAAMYQRDNS